MGAWLVVMAETVVVLVFVGKLVKEFVNTKSE